MVKNLPADAGDVGLVSGLGRSLEKGTATHSSVLAWRIPWTEDSRELQFTGSLLESDTTDLTTHTHIVREAMVYTKGKGRDFLKHHL